MTDDRRMTTDRFYGGVTNRLQNLRSMLEYVQKHEPSRTDLTDWVIAHTQAGSVDAVQHHLSFIDSIDVINLSETTCTLGEYGQAWLQDQDPETLYEALTTGVKGFEMILEALSERPMTDEEIMDLLVTEFEEAEMTTPGPAARHREWLQVLGLVDYEDGVSQLTADGRTLVGEASEKSTSGGADPDAVATEREHLLQALDEEPQLTEDETAYTDVERQVRDTAFSGLVKAAYDETCAICGRRRETPDGQPEVEAAHIYPKRKGGADDVRNGVALCKLHHWAFDSGWLSLTDGYEVLVRDAPEQDGYHEFKQLEGKRIRLPDQERMEPDPMYIERHREIHRFDSS